MMDISNLIEMHYLHTPSDCYGRSIPKQSQTNTKAEYMGQKSHDVLRQLQSREWVDCGCAKK